MVISRNIHIIYFMRGCSFIHYDPKGASVYKLKWHLYKCKNIRRLFYFVVFMVYFPFFIFLHWPTAPASNVDVYAVAPVAWEDALYLTLSVCYSK